MDTLKNTIEKHIKWLQGPNLTKADLPLDPNIGIGYEFTKDGERLKTSFEPDLKYGKRILKFRISTYRGISWDAVHYYCRAESYVDYEMIDKPGWSTGMSHFPEGFPEDSKDMKFELVRELSQEEIDENPERWSHYDAGDKVIAFDSEDEIMEIIQKLKPAFGKGWMFYIN